MKTSVAAAALGMIVVGCGSGAPPEQSQSLNPQQRSTEAASNTERQQVIDACKPPFTGANGTGGTLTRAFCGVTLPTSGSDRTPQRWWNFAGCITDHPNAFSNSCKNLFATKCKNGDQCICNTGQVLNSKDRCVTRAPKTCPPGKVLDHDDQTCVKAGACDNDLECPVANGLGKCSRNTESDPPSGRCSVASCNAGYVRSPDNESCVQSSCRVVNGIRWCYDPNSCSVGCAQVCANLGLPFTISDAEWFNAQNTAPKCQSINDAFGLGGVVLMNRFTWACIEDRGGPHTVPGGLNEPLNCSTLEECPSNHRLGSDFLGNPCSFNNSFRGVCPCQ